MTPEAVPAGRCLMLGFEGTRLEGGAAGALRSIEPAGVVLFTRNLATPEALCDLATALSRLLPYPLLVAIDQEGGRVSRLAPWVGPTPSAATLAAAGIDATRRFARATGEALRALGFNVNLAPVVDLCAPDAANGIGDRSFGTDPERVAALAGAFLDGLDAAGVAGCLKHFPGLGDTRVDSHHERPDIERDAGRLEREDLLPYRRLAGRVPIVMVGHGRYPALDPGADAPASLSREIVGGWLRGRLGFTGLVASDDLEMGAVSALDTEGAAAAAALAAGCDLLLYCRDLDRAVRAKEAIARQATRDAALAARLSEAAERVRRAAERWPRSEPDLAAWERACSALREASSRLA